MTWRLIDQALRSYSSASLLTVLGAALDSPLCASWQAHLLVLWSRVVRTPKRAGAVASWEDLPRLVDVAVRAAPGRLVLAHRPPNDPRALVAFEIGGSRLLVHPGELEQPMMFLRRTMMAAHALDPAVEERFGFTISDVVELCLRHSDRTLWLLAPQWPPLAEQEGQQPRLTSQEVDAAAQALALDGTGLVRACQHPVRAERALAWMTAAAQKLPLRYGPDVPLLSSTLFVTAHGENVPVPAAVTLGSLTAAVEKILAVVHPGTAHEARLQQLAVERAGVLLGLTAVPVEPGEVFVASSPALRMDIAVVSALAPGQLGPRVERARTELLASTAGSERARLVLYAGPAVLRMEMVTDTLMVHVEEFAEMLSDAGGDLSTLACFVLEMVHHPTVERITAFDVMDLWGAWCAHGTLLPPGPPQDQIAVVRPYPSDPTWDRAAAWARADDVLVGAGLSESLEWRTAQPVDLDGPFVRTADLFGDRGEIAVAVCADPALVIAVTTDPAARPVLDLGMLLGLADGLRTTIAGTTEIADHFRLPNGAPVFIHLVEADVPSDREERHPEADLVVDFGMDADQARVSIHLDAQLLTRFADDGSDGHHLLGQLLYRVLSEFRSAQGADPGTEHDRFSQAWDSSLPVMCINAIHDDWPASVATDTVLDSPYLHARALRTAADAIRAANVPSGTWSGKDSIQVAGRLLTTLENTLTDQIRSYEPALTTALARHLNAAWRARARDTRAVTGNLARPWADNWIEESLRTDIEGVATTAALHLLLQVALATPPAGQRPVDLLAAAELVAFADLTSRSGLTAVAAARHKMHDLEVHVDASGLFTLEGDAADDQARQEVSLNQVGFDLPAYQHAVLQHRIHQRRTTTHDLLDPGPLFDPHRERTPLAFNPPPLPPRLAEADDQLQQAWGTGLGALGAILATALDWPTDPAGLARTTESALVHAAAEWSNLPASELHAAVTMLLIGPHNTSTDQEHWYTEMSRRTRFTTQPLIRDGEGTILILPWLVHAARELYAGGLADARLLHPDLPKAVAETLQVYRQQISKQLERDIASIARQAGLPHLSNLIEKKAAQLGIPNLSGEIDLLVADPSTSRLWVVEAKHLEHASSLQTLSKHLADYTRSRKGYLDKLQAKVATIQAHAGSAAAACGVSETRAWRVLGLVVTYDVEPAAFLEDPRVPFTTVDSLSAVLARGEEPPPGWAGT